MPKKIQQNPPQEVEFPSTESTSKSVLNGRALRYIAESISIKIDPNIATAGISNQQPSTNSPKKFNRLLSKL